MTLQEYFLESEKCRPEKAVKTYPKVPAQSAKWHKSRNGALSPNDVTPGSHRKVWWQCDKGHSWEAPVYKRTKNNSSCPICSNKILRTGVNDLEFVFPQIAREWDYDKNAPMKPTEVTCGSSKTVWWKCSYGHEWQAQIHYRTHKQQQCPVCSKATKKLKCTP